MLSSIVALIFVLVSSASVVPASQIVHKHNIQSSGAITGTAGTAELFNNQLSFNNFQRKQSIVSGTAVNTFVKLCLQAIDRYNRENGASSRMKNYPRSVKQLMDLTENVFKNGRLQAKALAAKAMKAVQDIVDVGNPSLSNQVSINWDDSQTGTLNMWTEIYLRWRKTYPDIFWDDSAPVKAPNLVSNRATGRNTVEKNNPNTFILSGENSKKEHAGLFEIPQEIKLTPLMPTATDRGSIANSQMKGRKTRTNSKRKQIVEGLSVTVPIRKH